MEEWELRRGLVDDLTTKLSIRFPTCGFDIILLCPLSVLPMDSIISSYHLWLPSINCQHGFRNVPPYPPTYPTFPSPTHTSQPSPSSLTISLNTHPLQMLLHVLAINSIHYSSFAWLLPTFSSSPSITPTPAPSTLTHTHGSVAIQMGGDISLLSQCVM